VIDFFQQIGDFIMAPLYFAISFVLDLFHQMWSNLGLDPAGGAAWALSIIGLTLVIRAALIPLFVKQIKSSRNMQLIQPKVKELQKKYGHDRERLAQETMKLYKDSGTNPFASCLPILLQMPIFFALFSILNNASKGEPKGVLTQTQADQFGAAELLGVPLSQTFVGADGAVDVMVMAAFLVLAMTATTFLTQRQLMSKNMPADALTGPYAQQQKFLLFVLPLVFAIGGIAFPIGVLLYWTTSNLWTMGQQFYVIRNNPAPGTPAFAAKEARDAAKAARHGTVVPETGTETGATDTVVDERPAQRQQPKRQSREQRKKQGKGPQKGSGQQKSRPDDTPPTHEKQ
jgi:YidC/Oxa1 family membrane protein insertase